MKELYIRPEITNNDLAHKLARVEKQLAKGHQVKVAIKMTKHCQHRLYDKETLKTNFLKSLKYYLSDEQIIVQELVPVKNQPVRVMLSVK